jgi:hypothetical protein
MEEVWIDIEGYNGQYKLSNMGIIKSFKNKKVRDGIVLKPRRTRKNNNWYLAVVVQDKGIRRSPRLHRIVAEYFIPNPENKREVNHIDGDKNNNRVDNLEWSTPKENADHAKKTGLILKGENCPRSILTEEQVIMLRSRSYGYGDKRRICKELGIDECTLFFVLSGKSWSHLNHLTPDNIKNKTYLFHKS